MDAPKIGQDAVREVFAAGQTVLVRSGTEWHSREILGITVLRHDALCPNCGRPLLGEPRFCFRDYGNMPLEKIMAKEDIDPVPPQLVQRAHVKRVVMAGERVDRGDLVSEGRQDDALGMES